MHIEILRADGSPGVQKISDGFWVAKVDLLDAHHVAPGDQRLPADQRPLPIKHRCFAHVLGVDAERAILLPQRSRVDECSGFWAHRTERLWVVSSKPFVAVMYDQHDGEPHRALARGFLSARQIHRGELGRFVPIDQERGRYETVEGRILDPRDSARKRLLNWVRLSDLARLTKLDPIELLRWFARFSPSTYEQPNMFVLFGTHPQREYCEPHRLYIGDTFPRSFCGGEEMWGGPQEIGNAIKVACRLDEVADDIRNGVRKGPYGDFTFGEIWLTQQMAQTILRLTQFGYRPDCEEPSPSFALMAKPLDLSAKLLPLLSDEEMAHLAVRHIHG